jgi:gluconolactonase
LFLVEIYFASAKNSARIVSLFWVEGEFEEKDLHVQMPNIASFFAFRTLNKGMSRALGLNQQERPQFPILANISETVLESQQNPIMVSFTPIRNGILSSVLLFLFACGPTQETARNETTTPDEGPVIPGVVKLDDALDQVIAVDATIEVLSSGHSWTEGPVWVETEQKLLFSDIPPNKIFQWSEADGPSEYLYPSGYTDNGDREGEPGSNGLLLNAEGQLVLCQHGDRRMARMDAPLNAPAGNFLSLADKYEGKRFNSPNDATFRSNGDLYFTDPPYGLEKQMDDPKKEIPFQGVYRLDTEGTVHLLTDELSRPNGIAFSPDEKTLYVANSDPQRAIWMAYDVQEDGSIANGRVFFDATADREGKKGLPDGMKVDGDGILYATGPGGVLIFSPDGKHLGTIDTGQATSNCAIGNGGAYLYMTADDYLMRVALR